jgi:hypothetical protein
MIIMPIDVDHTDAMPNLTTWITPLLICEAMRKQTSCWSHLMRALFGMSMGLGLM